MSTSGNGITPEQEQAQLTEWANFYCDVEHDGRVIDDLEEIVDKVMARHTMEDSCEL